MGSNTVRCQPFDKESKYRLAIVQNHFRSTRFEAGVQPTSPRGRTNRPQSPQSGRLGSFPWRKPSMQHPQSQQNYFRRQSMSSLRSRRPRHPREELEATQYRVSWLRKDHFRSSGCPSGWLFLSSRGIATVRRRGRFVRRGGRGAVVHFLVEEH